MLVTSFRDPGVLPRRLDPNPEVEPRDNASFDLDVSEGRPKDLIISMNRVDDGGVPELGLNVDIITRWCTTCRIYRPPRCSHCRSCDNCIMNLDHHCVFLNTCIGRRNYTSFYGMLCHMLAMCFMGLAGCVLHLYYLAVPSDPNAKSGIVYALKTTPASIAFFWLILMWLIPAGCLWIYHTFLLLQNRSTVEQIRLDGSRELYDMPKGNGGCFGNFTLLSRFAMCSEKIRSWFVPEDFAPPIAGSAQKGREARRKRTPFQYANPLRNALVVLGRPTPSSSIT
ncbi:protein S-acyltransferase [Malassezia psittaci]|uniref:Palmitoyltransferase n=1 Tax=Malassezia psittaci TaxID=1821823 RepID=A0AAF0FDD9_9BASI|nr:protein S-acyltransferase [Malassezia psittaci]